MAKVIDISSKLTNEKPKLKITDDLVIEVNNSKNAVLLMNQKLETANTNNPEELDALLEILIGKEGVKAINDLSPSMPDFITIFNGVMACALGEDFDTVERRFREAAEE